ncbi:MAG: hypothetical protein J0L53_06165, partial [Spirochaetes bacterium]|nr:hypothetical protein [Spirochaetota bacterium]
MNVQKELMSIPDFGAEEEGAFAKEVKYIGMQKGIWGPFTRAEEEDFLSRAKEIVDGLFKPA